MKVGETISEAAVREAAEELGLRVRILQLIGVYSDPLFQLVAQAGGFTQYVTTVLRCGVGERTLAGSSEGLEWRWFPLRCQQR
jgi:8-oxo-dGTP pyrophosphatase MutT (NUDIX family)